jgi:ubiquinol-cytochrome c reductase cytochrome c subunit
MPGQRDEKAMKPIVLTLAGLILAAGQACAQQPSAPAGNVENGKTLYLQVGCYQCHGLAGQGAPMTGPRVSRTEFPFESFLVQLRQPSSQMPPYEAAILSDQDAADLYAYLRQMPPPRDPNSIPLLKAGR